MSDAYTKLAADIVYSSLWSEDGDTCKVWVTFLALKDRHGIVRQNLSGVSRITGIPLEKCQKAVELFCSPDPQSTSKILDGRRLQTLPDGGWLVVNHEKYQSLGWSEDKKRVERERKSKYRERKEAEPKQPQKQEPQPTQTKVAKFIKPTVDQIIAHGLPKDDAEDFFNYYQSCGWTVGKNKPMKDWESAATGWMNRKKKFNGDSGHVSPSKLSDAELLRQSQM